MAFLSRLFKKFSNGPDVSVGAFGKCPLWADHIYPDISIEGALSEFKQLLYLEGIRDRAIGSWGKADPSQLVPYGHVLIRLQEKHTVAARLWYSRDGRDRDDFPMVVAADCTGVSLAWILAEVLPELERLEDRIKRAIDRDAVPNLIAEATADLRRRVSASGGQGVTTEPTPSQALVELSQCADMGENRQGLKRVMHVLRDVSSRSMADVPPESLRVPRCASTPDTAIYLWARALEARFGHPPVAIFTAPVDGTYLDICVGNLDPAHFIALRASPHLIPLTTDISYAIDDDLETQVRDLVAAAKA